MKSYTTAHGCIRLFTDSLCVKVVDMQLGSDCLSTHSLTQLRNLEVDVFVVKHFLTDDEKLALLAALFKIPGNEPPLKESRTYPFSFFQINRNDPDFQVLLSSYFKQAKQFRRTFQASFGVDMEQKFTDVLTGLNQGHPAKILDIAEDKSCIPFTFRIIPPEKNHIKLHADNMFQQFAPEFYQNLSNCVEVHNQLSFFTVLQKPEQGGALSVCNVTWDVAKDFNVERESVILESGEHLHTCNANEVFVEKIDLDEGDLVIFAGGQLYHRIEEVFGQKMRVTLGGFIGYAKDSEAVYYWS